MMGRWVTFYYDQINKYASTVVAHATREEALKYFNKHFRDFFQLNTGWRADKLPATYGYPMRKYYGISSNAFKKMFGITVDEALTLQRKSNKE